MEDIDALNKPFVIPTLEELKAEQEKFEREHVRLKALPVASGKALADLVESTDGDISQPAFELPRQAAEVFASMTDFIHEYRDSSELYTEVQKLDVHQLMQDDIDGLKALGVSLRYAIYKLSYSALPPAKPWPASALYLVAFPLGEEPAEFAVPKIVRMGF